MTRGGPRKGAGRPTGTTKPDKKIRISVRLSPDVASWIMSFSKFDRADVVESAIMRMMENAD